MEPMETIPNTEQTTPSTPKSSLSSHNSTQSNTQHIQNPYQNNTNYQQCLNLWLQEARQTYTHTSNTPSPTWFPRNTIIQTILNPTVKNEHWGKAIQPKPSPDVLQVISKNVNSLNTDNNFVDLKATLDALAELNANVVCLQETNLHLQPDITLQIWQIICDSDLSNIPKIITRLEQCNQLTANNCQLLEEINQDFTTILVEANKKCRNYAQLWSLKLHQVYLIHQYWALKG